MRWYSFFLMTLLLAGSGFVYGTLSGSLDEKSIAERLKPEASVTIEGGGASTSLDATPQYADVGQQKYEDVCKMCHETGLANAPKFSDKSDWAPRIAQGIDALVKHAIIGIKAMPPRGGCSTCSDEEIKKAVEYMVNHSK